MRCMLSCSYSLQLEMNRTPGSAVRSVFLIVYEPEISSNPAVCVGESLAMTVRDQSAGIGEKLLQYTPRLTPG